MQKYRFNAKIPIQRHHENVGSQKVDIGICTVHFNKYFLLEQRITRE